MATQIPPKKNTANTFYVGLVSQANTKLFQVNPTLAIGDVKVSTDGGAFANITTLPVVTPAAGRAVKVDLSAAEMNGDNIIVTFVDAVGAEWSDLLVNLQTSARQIDDLAFPATTGRSMVVDVAGLIDATAVKVGPTGAGTAQTARDLGASVVAASVTAGVTVTTNNDKTGYSLSAAAVQAIWDALTSALTTVGSIGKRLVDNIDSVLSAIAARLPTALTIDGNIKADTLRVAGTIQTAGDIPARLPAALTGAGNIKADALAINGNTTSAAVLAILNGATVVYQGTVTGLATTTTLIDAGLTQADIDWWKGRIIIFTSVVTLQATDITAFDPVTKKLTFTALTAAPTGATYVII